MKFIPIRELRVPRGKLWKELKDTGEIVVTLHGQPVAVMVSTSGQELDQTLRDLRQARYLGTLTRLREQGRRKGARLTMQDIDKEIESVRRPRRK